jgi:predicted RNA binding protein YcfA (HicA-like mRNA interferase family)
VKLPALKRWLASLGFVEVRQRSSHHIYRREADGRRLTVALHPGREIHRGQVTAIRRDLERLHKEVDIT